jgi:hypothetical protein
MMGPVLIPLLAGVPTSLVAILVFLALAFIPVVVIVLLSAFFRFAARRVGFPGTQPPSGGGSGGAWRR